MDPLFATHLLNDFGITQARQISAAFEALLKTFPLQGDPRCLALARTNLETACFYAKKAMAMVPENQKKETP